jgi:NHS family xanthosine MFS transporter
MKGIKSRLIIMNFLQFAVWGSYLTSMGGYLFAKGQGDMIGWFYAMQGIVSMFMPAIMGIIADKWMPAQRLLGLCHAIAAIFIAAAGYFASSDMIVPIFALYSVSVAFYMPTLALSNSVAYTSLEIGGYDTVKAFPPIRVFGTVGFICTMVLTDVLGFQASPNQFFLSAGLGLVASAYALTLPACPVSNKHEGKSLTEVLGLKAFALFKQRKMALFFVFSVLLGVALQITNGFANPYLNSFAGIPEYADAFGVKHANVLISLSQLSETLCLLFIPFALKRFGIKYVMLIAMLCWVLRFALFGWGNPGDGVWMFVLSMLVYGVAFDFFNISGSLFVNQETNLSVRSSAQGLFMMMTNGLGATIGTVLAQQVMNHYVDFTSQVPQVEGWKQAWMVFAGYMLVVAVLFAWLFKDKRMTKSVEYGR